jgi:peptide-methionine (R)-S-oxide reductase
MTEIFEPLRLDVKPNLLSILLLLTFFIFTLNSFGQTKEVTMKKNTKKTEEQWAKELSAEKYQILRQCGTEPPFSGKYVNHKADGKYYCAGCGALLFSSDTKYDSGSGWPSFYAAADTSNIVEITDKSHGMIRTEIKCAKCGGHLGHVFTDGPKPTGMRYCVNSAALEFGE